MCHHHQRECVLVQNDIKLCTPYVAAYNLLERGCGSSTAVVLAIQCCYHQERCRKRINVRLQYLHNRLASQEKKKNAARSRAARRSYVGLIRVGTGHGPDTEAGTVTHMSADAVAALALVIIQRLLVPQRVTT